MRLGFMPGGWKSGLLALRIRFCGKAPVDAEDGGSDGRCNAFRALI